MFIVTPVVLLILGLMAGGAATIGNAETDKETHTVAEIPVQNTPQSPDQVPANFEHDLPRQPAGKHMPLDRAPGIDVLYKELNEVHPTEQVAEARAPGKTTIDD